MRTKVSALFQRGPATLGRWLRFPRRPDPRQSRATYAEVRVRLSKILPRFETLCVGASEKIEEMQSDGGKLLSECQILAGVASGRIGAGSVAHETLQLLHDPLVFIDSCQQQQEKLISVLATCEKQSQSMLAVRERMQAALAPLDYITILFKIESAGLPGEMRDTFLTVTAEVARMRQLVNETFNKNAQLLADAHETLGKVRSKLEAEFRANSQHVIERRRAIDQTISQMDRQLVENGQQDIRLKTESDTLEAEIGMIVGGLQFQDIVQQKCEHVLAALANWDANSPSPSAIQLQSLQLGGVAEDIASSHEKISGGIARIEKCLKEVENGSQQSEKFQGMVASADGMVQQLLEAITEVSEIISTVTKLTDQHYHDVQPAGEIASGLTSTLVELATNMHLIALNAQIRSVQIGEGTGLEQLAARTADISREINTISLESAQDLAKIRLGIKEMMSIFSEISNRGRQTLDRLTQARIPTEGHLHALRDHAFATIQAIGETSQSIQQSVKAVGDSIAPLHNFRAEFTTLSENLQRLAGPIPESAEQIAELKTEATRYTMASEHALHGKITGQEIPLSATDDIELFVEPIESASNEEKVPPVAARTPQKTEKAPVAAGNFDANIELF